MAASERGRGPASLRSRSGGRGPLRLLAAAGLLWLAWGCLNPLPDDQPHVDVLGPSDVAPVPRQETCDDNPLLAGCSASTPTGVGGSGNAGMGAAGSAAAGAGGSAGAAGSGGLEPDAGAGTTDSGPIDAGTTSADGGDADAP